jgi:hypothetical protein
MLIEIGLELLFGFVGIEQELLPRAEGQAADIAVGVAGCGSYEADDSEIAISHQFMITGDGWRVKSPTSKLPFLSTLLKKKSQALRMTGIYGLIGPIRALIGGCSSALQKKSGAFYCVAVFNSGTAGPISVPQ